MLVPNQIVEVKIVRTNIKYYRNIGYDVKYFDIITIPVEQLSTGSRVSVQVSCDICYKIYSKPYKRYIKQHTYGLDTCNKCKNIKAKKTCLDKYGVENVFQVNEFQEKCKQTCMERYGCEYISQTDIWKKECKKTMIERYGNANAMNVPELKEKQQNSIYEHYGVYNPLQSDEIKEKVFTTNLIKYGYKSALQNKEVKEKQMQTFYQNSTTPTSSQQLKLYDIIKQKYLDAKLNYPFSNCSLDIFIDISDIKIDIEYDGSYWHQNQQADIKRDKFLQSRGFKVLRIRSGHKLPAEEEIFTAINELATTNRIFKEIILSDWHPKQYKINEQQEVSI